MGPAPQLATYQAAAAAADQPLEQAEQTTDAATHQANLNTLQEQQSEIGPQYDQAVQALQTQLTGETGSLNQKYTEALQGNFSGLQGNDLGMLYSKANQDLTSIQTQRANALNEVATKITNEDLTYGASQDALTSKYQGQEAADANSAYSSAVSEYNTQAYQQEELGLRQEEIDNTEDTAANTTAAAFSLTGKNSATDDSGGYNFTGPNKTPINMAQYLSGSGGGTVDPNQLLALLQNGSSYDKSVYGQVKNLTGNQLLQTVANIDAKGTTVNGKKIGGANAYGF